MSILVIGGTGVVGKELLQELSKRGATVRCLTRMASNIGNFPLGVQGIVGDLEKLSAIKQAMEGIEKVFLLTPLSQNETKLGLNAVKAAKSAGVKKMVYMSAYMPQGSATVPHYATKIPVEKALKESGLDFTILQPNNFYQNDFWCKAALMLYNVYPQPIGNLGTNRIDAHDVAYAAANVLSQDIFKGETYTLHGPEVSTGDSVAKTYEQYIHKTIHYGGDDLQNWAKQAQHMMPTWMVSDFKTMYQFMQTQGMVADQQMITLQQQILQKDLIRFGDFVKNIIPLWKKEYNIP